jgi:hypothetical protein
MELSEVNSVILQDFFNIKTELNVDISVEIEDSTNIFDVLDSMDIVNLIMETESLLEAKLGYYLPLANEETFDAEKSPLLSYKSWLQFIFTLINNNAR